jgi:hypothetical protein
LTVEAVRGSRVVSRRQRAKTQLSRGAGGGGFGIMFIVALSALRAGRHPWLIVRNARGEVQVLWEELDWDEARTKRDQLAQEMEDIGVEAWCDRYNVPAIFANPDDAWRKPSSP